VRERLRNVFAKQRDPYAGVDLANASRFGGVLWFLGAIFTAALLPFEPPDDPIGDAGWALAGVVVIGALAAGVRMRSAGSALNVNELLLFSYLAIVGIAVLVWLDGGVGSPYGQLFVLGTLYTNATHPPRRLLGYLAVFAALVALPLVYDSGYGRHAGINLVTELFVWLMLSVAVMVLMHNVRMQRLGLRREGEQARQQARVDPLTGLLNRRAFDDDLRLAIERARATGEPLSVLVGDLDDFKDFNDRFGHLEGDAVLKAVARSLRAAVRRPDVAYRWGGDEFAVVLPQADRRGAEMVAERVQEAVRGNSGPDGEALGIATGVAEFDPDDHQSAATLLTVADQALMHAKGSGSFEVPGAPG
jgi:diguanylate cyclase (GGDEF)-like protein